MGKLKKRENKKLLVVYHLEIFDFPSAHDTFRIYLCFYFQAVLGAMFSQEFLQSGPFVRIQKSTIILPSNCSLKKSLT